MKGYDVVFRDALQQQKPRRVLAQQGGMTLIELTIVLVIVVVLAGGAVTFGNALNGLLASASAKGASQQVASAIQQARQDAITNSVSYCIAVGGTTYEITVANTSGTPCPGTTLDGPVTLTQGANVSPSVTFTFAPPSTVTPVGPTALTVTTTVSGATCSATVTVTPAGGVQAPAPPC